MDFQTIQKAPVIVGWLSNQITRWGISVTLYAENKTEFITTVDPQSTDTYNDVYGTYAGVQAEVTGTTITVLFPPGFFHASDGVFESFPLDTHYLYTLDSIQNGDIIEVIRSDSKVLRYKAVEVQTVGMESVIITRFQITILSE